MLPTFILFHSCVLCWLMTLLSVQLLLLLPVLLRFSCFMFKFKVIYIFDIFCQHSHILVNLHHSEHTQSILNVLGKVLSFSLRLTFSFDCCPSGKAVTFFFFLPIFLDEKLFLSICLFILLAVIFTTKGWYSNLF